MLAAITVSCGADEPRPAPAPPPVVRDSAGVAIVENRAPAWREGLGWRVDGRPSVHIGVVEGDADYAFDHVDSAWRLPDGRIAVAVRGAPRLRFYSARGRFLHATGREGEGPGEFRTLYVVRPFRGDSLMAYDSRLERISILDSEGRFGRSMPVRLEEFWAMGTLRDSLIFFVTFGPVGMRDPKGSARSGCRAGSAWSRSAGTSCSESGATTSA